MGFGPPLDHLLRNPGSNGWAGAQNPLAHPLAHLLAHLLACQSSWRSVTGDGRATDHP